MTIQRKVAQAGEKARQRAAELKRKDKKLKEKTYSSHSQYPGGYKEVTAEQLAAKKPGEILRRAIKGMLPKTRLGDAALTRVRIYNSDQHPHKAQAPQAIQLTRRAGQEK